MKRQNLPMYRSSYIKKIFILQRAQIMPLFVLWGILVGLFVVSFLVGKGAARSAFAGIVAFFVGTIYVFIQMRKWQMYHLICPFCGEGLPLEFLPDNAAGNQSSLLRTIIVKSPVDNNICPACRRNMDQAQDLAFLEENSLRRKVQVMIVVLSILLLSFHVWFCFPNIVTSGMVEEYERQTKEIAVPIVDADSDYLFRFNAVRGTQEAKAYTFYSDEYQAYFCIYAMESKKYPSGKDVDFLWDVDCVHLMVNQKLLGSSEWGKKSRPIPIFNYWAMKEENPEMDEEEIQEINSCGGKDIGAYNLKTYLCEMANPLEWKECVFP